MKKKRRPNLILSAPLIALLVSLYLPKKLTYLHMFRRFTPSGGGRSRKGGRNRGGPGSRGSSTPGSRAVSEDLEPELTPNSSDMSEEEDIADGIAKARVRLSEK